MRDLVLALIIFGSVPIILARPWVGIIMWSWISFMNPHRLAWGYMYDINIAMIIGVATLIGWAITKEDRRVPLHPITVLMVLFLVSMGVSTIFAVNPVDAQGKLLQFFKIILMTVIAISLIKKPDQLRWLIWITVLSICFFSFKGGIWTVVTGGNVGKVWGPPDTFIEDNNALALATLMIIPLMVYLAQTSEHLWVRYGMYAAGAVSLISVVGSYSRGGFIGMAAIAVLLWLRSRRKLVIGTAAAICIAVGISFVPQQWFDRMDTIQHYEEDGSAVGRLQAWTLAIRIANERPLVGGGHGVFWHDPTAQRLYPDIDKLGRNAHSIYFEPLGNQGYLGLLIFLLLGTSALLTTRKIKRLTRGREGFENEYKFANMMQITLVAYAVSGTFQNLATYDMYYMLLATIVIQYTFLKEKLSQGASDTTSTSAAVSASTPVRPAPLPERSFLRHQSQ